MLNLNENIKAKLNQMMDDENDQVFVWVDSKSKDGMTHGSFTHVKREQLRNRKYKLKQMSGGKIGITFLDSTYDPKTFKWSKPL